MAAFSPPPRNVPLAAVLLAGGRSSRMGRDKALLTVDGVPLWQRQRDLLATLGPAELWLSARPEQDWARTAGGFTGVLHDAMPDCGPLAGITAALERAGGAHVAVLAIDLPRMSPAWFEQLLPSCSPGAGAVGRRGDFFEPLAAIYPRELMTHAWEALAGRRYALQPLLAQAAKDGLLRIHETTTAQAAWFENWNEPAA